MKLLYCLLFAIPILATPVKVESIQFSEGQSSAFVRMDSGDVTIVISDDTANRIINQNKSNSKFIVKEIGNSKYFRLMNSTMDTDIPENELKNIK